MIAHDLDANRSVLEAFRSKATAEELAGLGGKAVRTIKAKLRWAGPSAAGDVEDVIQDSLLLMHKIYERQRQSILDVRSFFVAVAGHCARRHLSRLRRAERVRASAEEWAAVTRGATVLPEEALAEERQRVLAALPLLGGEHRRLLELLLIEGLDDAQLGERLQISQRELRKAKGHAIAAIRERLELLAALPASSRRAPQAA